MMSTLELLIKVYEDTKSPEIRKEIEKFIRRNIPNGAKIANGLRRNASVSNGGE